MTRMSLADFEARYRADPDPWGYDHSRYERAKYLATLSACGRGPFASALELGASIGAFTALLAPRCQALITLDGAPTAVALARRRLIGDPALAHVEVRTAVVPADIPDGPFDLVVASEILYYLDASELQATLDRVAQVMTPGGRLVAVHWRPAGPERPLSAAEVHSALRAAGWLRITHTGHTTRYMLDAGERR